MSASMKFPIVLTVALCCLQLAKSFAVIYAWTQLDFMYTNKDTRLLDMLYGVFTPKNCIPMDVDVQYLTNGPTSIRMTFVTVPRFKDGVPATLGTIMERRQGDTENPLIVPFPDWNWHQHPELCKEKRLVSVIRVQIDQCGRLWVLDSGRIKGKIICPPQILVFALSNYEVLRRYEIPREQYEGNSLFVTIAVECLNSKGYCSKKPFAYIADSRDNSLIVYDYRQNESWKIKHKSFAPVAGNENIIFDGDQFHTIDGIVGLAVDHSKKGKSLLYYYPQGSNEQSRVKTRILKSKHSFIDSASFPSDKFETFPNKINLQRSAAAFSSKGSLYFCSITDSSIKYWKTTKQFSGNNILTMIQNDKTLQYPSGMKIIKNAKGKEELYVLSNRLAKFVDGSANSEEINFRIQYEPNFH